MLDLGLVRSLIKKFGTTPDPSVIAGAVDDYLEEHPEATAPIDDTAGEGDTGKIWSADKTATVTGELLSAITPVENSTATGVDLDVSDENGNVVLRIADGNIRTKNFISDNGIYESQFEYDNTAGTETITHFFPKGSRLAFHLTNAEDRERDGIVGNTITYKYTTPSGSTYTLGTAYGFNFPEYVLPNDAASVSVQYGTGLNFGSNATLSFKVYSIGSIPRQPNIITVGTGKDYTSLRAAVEYARQYADELNRYEIRIDAGTYDIMSYYTAEEIATEGFIGLMVSNGISLVGMGQRSEVILTATLSTSDYNETKRNYVSTLNIRGNTGIRNMTIKAENIRYAVHDDSSMFSDQNDTHIFDCVTFVGKNLTSSNDSDLSYGAGGANLKKLFFYNCDFSDALTLHTSDNMYHEYTAYFINCRARMMQFGDYNSGIPAHVYLKNCSVAKVKIGTSGSHDQYLLIEGEGTNGAMIASPEGYVYALDGVHKFAGSNVSAGVAVKLSSNMSAVQAATDLDEVYGVSIGVLNGVTYVQTEGWLNSNTLGLTSLSVGDYLTINTGTGAVEVGTASNAIAQVKHVDSDSVAYAKLM